LTFEWRRLLNEQLYAGLTHESLAGVEMGPIGVPDPPIVSLLER